MSEMDQGEDHEIVAAVTEAMREADRAFQRSGGGSRHYVRDCFLWRLNRAGYRIVRAEVVAADQERPRVPDGTRREDWEPIAPRRAAHCQDGGDFHGHRDDDGVCVDCGHHLSEP